MQRLRSAWWSVNSLLPISVGVKHSRCQAFAFQNIEFVDCEDRASDDTVSYRVIMISEAIQPSPWSSFQIFSNHLGGRTSIKDAIK